MTSATLLAAGALALGSAGCSDDADNLSAKLTLLFTSDEHSHMLAVRPELDDFPPGTSEGDGTLVGGVARRAALLEAERERAAGLGAATLTLSAGDNTMGALPAVVFASDGADYQMLSALKYDATTLGNHEFDFGPAALAAAIGAARSAGAIPPIVASNIRFDAEDPGDDAVAALYGATGSGAAIEPYRVLETPNGIRVGLLGWAGAEAALVAPNKTPVLFSAEASGESDADATLELMRQQIQPLVDHLRNAEGVDLVIGLGHSGMRVSADGSAEGEDPWLCANLQGLDVIISGHSHNRYPAPVVVPQADGRSCTVLNGGAYGELVGRVDLTVELGGGASPTFDAATQTLLPVNDALTPDPALGAETTRWVDAIEAASDHGEPYLERLLGIVEDTNVANDPTLTGDLYFRPIGHTSFAVSDDMMLNYLSGDAMLTAMDALGIPTMMALESAGVTRAVIEPGVTGTIALSDAYNVVPLGNSALDGTLGYPLVHVFVEGYELRAVFEFAATLGSTNSDYLLGQAGVRVTYDKTRPPVEDLGDLFSATKGWVMRIEVDTDHSDGFEQFDTVLYDREADIEPAGLISAVTSSYIAQFAASVGVTLKNESGDPISAEEAIVFRADLSEVKQLEAFLTYLYTQPDGELPERYDADSPDRTLRQICDDDCD